MTEKLEQLHQTLEAARAEVRRVILGQDEVIDAALVVILAREHALLEVVPGVAKTLLARTPPMCSAANSRASSSLPI